MKWQMVGVLFLIACAQTPEPIVAPATVVMTGCEATRSIGEGCRQTCECLRPGKCLNDICSLTELSDGQPCVNDVQCLSGQCKGNVCGTPEGPTATYDCEYECRQKIDSDGEECKTVCTHR